MIERILVLPDVHLTAKVPKEYKVVKPFIKDFKPHRTILLGDFMDCESVSHWIKDKARLIEGKRYKQECLTAQKELNYINKHSKKVIWLEGNHENWVEQYVDKHPEMEGLIEIPEVMNLDSKQIDWIPQDEIYCIGHLNFIHGWYTTKYHAAKHLDAMGDCVIYGHTHLPQSFSKNMALHKEIMGYGLGCLCGKAPEYMRGRFANWINQFAVIYHDTLTGNFNLYPINVIDYSFIWNGKRYISLKK